MKRLWMAIMLVLGLVGLTFTSALSAYAVVDIYTYQPDGSINNVYACHGYTTHNNPRTPISIVDNTACNVRVVLGHHSPGWSFCISPRAFSNIPSTRQDPNYVLVTTDTHHC